MSPHITPVIRTAVRVAIVSLALAAAVHAPAVAAAKLGARVTRTSGKPAPGPFDRTQAPALSKAPGLKLPVIHRAWLPNGLELDVVSTHRVPVVDVTLIVFAGAARDPEDMPGLATFTANMLDEGAGTHGALALAEEIDYLGASLTTSAGVEMAQVNLHVPRSRLQQGLALMADVALTPAFADTEITRQRELRKTQLLQLRDQPVAISPIAFNAIVLGAAHPYAHPSGGTEAATAALSRERVLEFYNAFYRPNNARLLIVGDVTLDDAKAIALERFGKWKKADVAKPREAVLPAASPRTFYLVDKAGAAQSVIRIGHVGVERSNPDYYPLFVLNNILGGSFTSRLNQNLRETHGYTYGATSAFEMRRLAGPFRAGASVVTAKTDSAVIEFLKEIRRIRDEAVPQEELDKAKHFITLGLPGEFEGTAGAASQYLDLITNDLPLDTYAHTIGRIEAVSAADIQRVARQYIDPDRFSIVIVGDRSKIEDGLKALGEGPIVLRDLWGHELTP